MTESFPNEIWKIILRLATIPDSSTDTYPNPIALTFDTVSEPIRPKYNFKAPPTWHYPLRRLIDTPESLRTKAALARVSLDFYDLSCEFLYENVYVDDAKTAARLVQALQRQPSAWTRYVYVRMGGRPTNDAVHGSMTANLARILQLSVNLRGLFCTWDLKVENGLTERMGTLLRAMPSSIELFEWKSAGYDWNMDAQEEISQLLRCATTLRGLRLIGKLPDFLQHVTFPQLQYLDLRTQENDLGQFQRWQLPSLTHLTISTPRSDSDSTFLTISLPSLTFLSFTGYGPTFPPHLFQQFLFASPNLLDLVYQRNLGKEGPDWESIEGHKSLQSITLHNNMGGFIVTPLRSGRFPWLEDAAEDLRLHVGPLASRRFPGLKSFKVVNLRHVRPNDGDRKELHMKLSLAAKELSDRGVEVTIED